MYIGGTSIALFRRVAAYYGTDILAMRRYYRQATNRSQSVPLVIPPRHLTLFAYKSRCTNDKNIGAVGYVANTRIQSVEEDPDGPGILIQLKSGHTLKAPVSLHHFHDLQKTAGFFQYYLHMNNIMPL